MNFNLSFQKCLAFAFIIIVTLFSCSNNNNEGEKQEQNVVKQDSSKKIFEGNCAVCHGKSGDAGISGAANLRISKLSLDGIEHQISDGKGNMPPFKSVLNEEQIKKLAVYVQTLRN